MNRCNAETFVLRYNRIMFQKAKTLSDEIIHIRRHLHQYPELSFQEIETSKFIADLLHEWGIPFQENIGRTGIVAEIGSGDGPIIAIRADMDALPITEDTDHSFASKNIGVMHACGHDAHVAMALGAAKLLKHSFDTEGWNGRVRFLFQPSEESYDENGVSGATAMIEDGALDGVEIVIAQHIWSTQPSGTFLFESGYSFASVDTFKARIFATGGHGAFPHVGTDPFFMLSSILPVLYGIPSRRISPLEPCVISIGQITGGETSNVIPAEVMIYGTMRAYNPAVREQIWAEVEQAFNIANAMGGSYTLSISKGYPSLKNDPAVTQSLQDIATKFFGNDCLHDGRFGMAAEDFSYMTNHCTGAMFLLGGMIDDGIVRPHHTPIFDIDESVLWKGTAVLAEKAHCFVNK